MIEISQDPSAQRASSSRRRHPRRRFSFVGLVASLSIGLFVALAVVIATGACGSGWPVQIEAKDLTGAEFTDLYPSSCDSPSTEALDLDDAAVRDGLLSAYASMTAWSGDERDLPEPDLQLTLLLAGDRRVVLSLAREDDAFVRVERYKGSQLVDTSVMQPELIYGFMNDLVIEPGGW
jgi:hypothetical protein